MRKKGIVPNETPTLVEKAKKIKIFLTDCDGCLTDGGMYYAENGDEIKKFNTKDGMGISLLHEKGIIVGIITGEDSQMVYRRANKLKIDELHCGVKNKLQVVNDICQKYGCTLENVAYVGDDINDLDTIKAVGMGFSVSNGIASVKNVADYVTNNYGGNGAIREIIDKFFI